MWLLAFDPRPSDRLGSGYLAISLDVAQPFQLAKPERNVAGIGFQIALDLLGGHLLLGKSLSVRIDNRLMPLFVWAWIALAGAAQGDCLQLAQDVHTDTA